MKHNFCYVFSKRELKKVVIYGKKCPRHVNKVHTWKEWKEMKALAMLICMLFSIKVKLSLKEFLSKKYSIRAATRLNILANYVSTISPYVKKKTLSSPYAMAIWFFSKNKTWYVVSISMISQQLLSLILDWKHFLSCWYVYYKALIRNNSLIFY